MQGGEEVNEKSQNIISKLLGARGAVLEALVMATLFGLAINLFSGLISDALKEKFGWQVFLAAALVLSALVLILRRLAKERISKNIWVGVVGLENKGNRFIDLLIYSFSKNIFRYVQAASKGDAVLRQEWADSEIRLRSPEVILSGWFAGLRKPSGERPVTESVAEKMIREAAEAYVLSVVSSSLLDLAQRAPEASFRNISEGQMRALAENNGVLQKISERKNSSDLKFSAGFDGAVFLQSDMYLPDGSDVFRHQDGRIVIETTRVRVEIRVSVPGLQHFEMPEFGWLFVKKDPAIFKLHKVFVETQLTVLGRGIFDFTSWWEQRWVEQLEKELSTRIDFESFKHRVNFEAGLFGLRLRQVAEEKRKDASKEGG